MSPAVGMRFGRYELLQKLGAGGMGVVFRARDHDLGRDVAVKFLSERYASDADGLERFAKEARAASSLNHPNIVTIHEIGRAEGQPFIVMECVNGQTLRALMSGRLLPTRRILDLAVQTADGLAQAHAAGIVHRDLKPENLMVTAEGFVKILDFGLAKLRTPLRSDAAPRAGADASTAVGVPVSTWSSEGVVVGTVGYMSPEQAAGKPVDFRADQFALGTILYEMVAGRRAFKRDTPVQTLSAVIESDPESLATVNPSFPAPGRWVVERCLAKEPDERYASTADLARELRAVREHLSEVSNPTPDTRDRRIPKRRWPWRAAAGALVVLAVLFAVPPLREGVLGPLQLLPLPAEKLVAVLPFHNAGANPDDQALCDGLPEYIAASLGQLQRFHDTVSVVPSAEVRQSGVSTAEQARRALGATLVVTGSLQRERQRLIVTASLSDAVRGRQLRGATLDVTLGRDSPFERVVEAVVGMLDLELGPDGTAALRAGTSGVAEASTLYGQALGYKPYSQARNALQRHDQERSLERAIDLFNQALARDRNFALAHAGLGEALWRLSRFTKNPEQVALAEEHCRRALDLDPLVWQAWVTMGIIHAGTGKAAEAVDDFQRALARDPRSSDAHRELANAYDRLGQRDRVEATYRKAIELRPDYWVSYSYFGSYLVTHGRASDAEAQYKKALAIVPDNARAWSGLGAAYYAQQKYDEAERAWRKSLALFPTSAAASNLGTRQFFQGRYAEAARDFERALQIDDRDYRVWRNLAASYYWAPGQRDKAGEAYRRAATLGEQERELDPQDPATLADLADSYAMLGEADKARTAAAGAARLGGDRMFIARMLAGVYEQLGDRTAALEWVGKALAMGLPPDEVEKAPSLAGLRADPRYQSRVQSGKAAASGAAVRR